MPPGNGVEVGVEVGTEVAVGRGVGDKAGIADVAGRGGVSVPIDSSLGEFIEFLSG